MGAKTKGRAVYRVEIGGVEFVVREEEHQSEGQSKPALKWCLFAGTATEPAAVGKTATAVKAALPKALAEAKLKQPKGKIEWRQSIEAEGAPVPPKDGVLPLPSAPSDEDLVVDVPDAAAPILLEQQKLAHDVAINRVRMGEKQKQIDEAKAVLDTKKADLSELQAKEQSLFEGLLDCQRDLESGQARLNFRTRGVEPIGQVTKVEATGDALKVEVEMKEKAPAKPKRKRAAKKKSAKAPTVETK